MRSWISNLLAWTRKHIVTLLSVFLMMGFLGWGGWALNRYLETFIRDTVVQQLSTTLNKEIRIQQVSHILGFEFVLKGISVSDPLTQGSIATIKEAVIFYNPITLLAQLSGLKQIANPLWIHIKEPDVKLDISIERQFSIPKKDERSVNLPFTSVHLTVNRGNLTLRIPKKSQPVTVNIRRIAGSWKYSFWGSSRLNWVGFIGKSRLSLKGSFRDPLLSNFDGKITLSEGDLPFLTSLFIDPNNPNPLKITDGKVDLSFRLKTEGNQLKSPAGTLALRRGVLRHTALPNPVEDLSARISIRNDEIAIESLEGSYEKNSLKARGIITLGAIPKLQGEVQADALDLRILKGLIPQLAPVEIQGEAKIAAIVSGELLSPTLSLEINSKNLGAKGYIFEDFSARLAYKDQFFRIENMEGRIAQGKVQGKGLFHWQQEKNFFELGLQLNNVQVFPLLQKYYPRLKSETVRGSLTGYLSTRGSLDHFSGESRLVLVNGKWRNIPIQHGEIDLVFSEKGLTLNSMGLEAGKSKILISGNMDPLAKVEGSLVVENLPLQEIQDLLPEGFPISSGDLFADVSFYGPFPDIPEKLSQSEARGTVHLNKGKSGLQEIETGTATFLWENNILQLKDLKIYQKQTEILGEGRFQPAKVFEESQIYLSLYSHHFNLEDFRLLEPWVGKMTGKSQDRIQGWIEGSLKQPVISFEGRFTPFSIGDFSFQGASGKLTWDKNILSFIQTIIYFDNGSIHYSGSIDFAQQDPELKISGQIIEVKLSRILKDPSFLKTLDTLAVTQPKAIINGKQAISFPPISLGQFLDLQKENLLTLVEDWVKTNPGRRRGITQEVRPLLEIEGLLEGRFSLGGNITRPKIQMIGSLSQGRWKEEHFDGLSFDIEYQEETTQIKRLELHRGDGSALLTGNYTLKGPSKIQGTIRSLPLALVKPLFPTFVRKINGNIDGNIVIQGKDAVLRYSGELKSIPFSLNGLSFDEAYLRLHSTQDLLTIEELKLKKGQDSSSLSGQIPLNKKNTPLELRLLMVNDALGLFPSLSSDLGWSSGKGRLQLTIEGSLEKPEIRGNLIVQEGILSVAGLPNGLKNVSIHAELQYPKVELKTFNASSGSGSLTATGTLLLEGFTIKEANLPIHFEDLLVNNPQYVGLIDGDLTFVRQANSNSLSGTIILTRGEVPIILTPPPVVPPPFPIGINWRVTFQEGQITLVGQDMNIETAGQLVLTGPIELPVLQGELSLLRGRAVLFSNEFHILKGRAEYLPAYGYDPYVEVDAQTRMANLNYNSTRPEIPEEEKKYPYYEIRAIIRGRSSSYNIDFEVDYPKPAPVFLTRDKILRFLGHAQALEQEVGQSLISYEAQRYAATALRLQTLRKFEAEVESALGLESFQLNLDPSQEATNIRVNVVKKIGDHLYLNYEPVFAWGKSQAWYSLGARYNITENLSIFGQTLKDNNVVNNRSEDKAGLEMRFPLP